MEIHSLNSKTPSATDVLALDTGSDTYKATGTAVVENAAPTYTSGDAASPTSWADVTVLSSGLSVKTLLNRISTMIKNVRWLYSKLGTTELGTTATTITGAIAEHESDISGLNSKLTSDAVPNMTNINTVLNIGVYLLSGAYTYTNAPDTYGVLEVLAPTPSGSIKVQRLTTVNTVYIRYYSESTWTAWRKITSVAIT